MLIISENSTYDAKMHQLGLSGSYEELLDILYDRIQDYRYSKNTNDKTTAFRKAAYKVAQDAVQDREDGDYSRLVYAEPNIKANRIANNILRYIDMEFDIGIK